MVFNIWNSKRFKCLFPSINLTEIVCPRTCVHNFNIIDPNFWSQPRLHTQKLSVFYYTSVKLYRSIRLLIQVLRKHVTCSWIKLHMSYRVSVNITPAVCFPHWTHVNTEHMLIADYINSCADKLNSLLLRQLFLTQAVVEQSRSAVLFTTAGLCKVNADCWMWPIHSDHFSALSLQ